MNRQNKGSVLPIIVVMLLLLAMPLVILAINLGFNPFVSADPTEAPSDVIAGNITSNSVTISFITPSVKTQATIKYGTNPESISLIANDKRESDGTSELRINHIFDLVSLTPQTTYYYIPVIGGQEYLNNGQPFQFNTFASTDSLATPNPFRGAIDPASGGALVYTHAVGTNENSTVSQAITAENGTFTFDLTTLKNIETGEVFDTEGKDIISYASTEDGRRGAIMFEAGQNAGTLNVSDTFAFDYSPEIQTVPGEVTVTPTSNPQVTTTPTITVTPTPQPNSILTAMLFDNYSTGQELTDSTLAHNIFISNITAQSFNINWLTKEPTTASVRVTKSGQEKVYLDIRDSSVQSRKLRFSHSVFVSTNSYAQGDTILFEILTNDQINKPSSSDFFEFIVPEVPSSPPTPESVELKVAKNFTPSNDRDQLIAMQKSNSTGSNKSTWKTDVSGSENITIAIGDTYENTLDSYFSDTTFQKSVNAFAQFNSLDKQNTVEDNLEITLNKGTSLSTIRQGSTINSATQISGTANPRSQVIVSINDTENKTTSNALGDWSIADPLGILAGENNILVTSGGQVLGATFNFTLGELPATDLSDYQGVIIATILVLSGFLLRRYVIFSRKKDIF